MPRGILGATARKRGLLGEFAPQVPSAEMGLGSNIYNLIRETGQSLAALGGPYTSEQARAELRDPNSKIRADMMQAAMLAPFGITAFHGSPYKFDKFDMSKIGTGEGAQAYGHGLYFAERPEVAKQYQTNLTGGRLIWEGSGGVRFDAAERASQGDLAAAMLKQRGSVDEAIQDVMKAFPNEFVGGAKEKSDALHGLLQLKEQGFKRVPAGYNYHVDIPDEAVAKMLDWDKPLSQQPESVRGAVVSAFGDVRPVRLKDGSYSVTRVSPDGSGRVMYGILEKTPEAAMNAFPRYLEGQTGGDMLRELSGLANDPAKASEVLRQMGIPGIKYLDQGSRGTGQGTSNFVLFDENLAKILERK